MALTVGNVERVTVAGSFSVTRYRVMRVGVLDSTRTAAAEDVTVRGYLGLPA